MERRASSELTPKGRKLTGYVARFDEPIDLGEFVEVVRAGAFTRTLAGTGAQNIRAIYEHDGRALLGRLGAGTLRLSEDAVGLAFEIDLPDTTLGRDLAHLVERGDVAGCSFGFLPVSDAWSEREGRAVRELTDVDLIEVTITASPAYDTTSVQVRASQPLGIRLARLYVEACQ
ncbi:MULTISPECIES: HK97 family phage prohead protease [Halomonadaceae]|uniref:HK97 family phage prohead protease n=1 Tax=Halomonadaceae TaxID=28256 RepID=UPI000C328AA1|nr:HK97 family phage prohead protease [Halomonas sp. MES3-P3E]PKG49282.1 HK97 family phage prohead protease [Halomonas sp. MES3-P3E]